MRSCLASAIVLAACGGTGFQIEVRVDDAAIVRVELIMGVACEQCPKSMAAPLLAVRETTVYATAQPTAWYADVVAGAAGFVLDADGTADEKVPLLAVVGLDAAGRPVAIKTFRDVVIPAHGTKSWRVFLEPIKPIDDNGQPLPDGSERAAVWRHPAQPEPSCVMVEDWSGGVASTIAIVPPEDPDCDRAANECAANVPNAMLPPTLDRASCVVPAPVFASNVCLLGGTPCFDDGPATSACLRIADGDYCVPSALCTSCAPDGNNGCVFGQLIQHTPTGELPQLACHVPITSGGALCAGPATITINASTVLSPGATCTKIYAVSNYFGGAMRSDSIPVPPNGKMTLSNFRAPCTVDVTFSGTTSANAYSLELIGMEFASGRNIVIPFQVQVITNCNEMLSCAFSQGTNMTETVFNCARLN